MNLKVGANIRELRHKQGITQEKLADKLVTTPQAVSRWESGVGYPDTELLPRIADAFGVSMDGLFGRDAREKEAKIQYYLEECQRLGSLGEEEKRFALMREALELFPLDHRIMLKYGWAKASQPYDERGELRVSQEECDAIHESIIAVCNRVLDDNPADELRYDALSLLGTMYRTMGKTDEAAAVAKRFPKMQSYQCQELDLLLAYDSESEEYALQLQEMTETWADMLANICIRWQARRCGDDREKIRLLQKAIAVYELVYDDGNFGFFHNCIARLRWEMGDGYLKLGELDKAIGCFEQVFAHARAFDGLPAEQPYTAALVNRLAYKKIHTLKDYQGTMLAYILPQFAHERYDTLREDERFRALLMPNA
jgi:transcriptional regulator with XRE-family HTH domain